MSENINAFIRWESEIRGVGVNVEGFPVWTNISFRLSTGHLVDSNSDGIWVDALVTFQLPFCLHLIVNSYGLRPVSNLSSSNLAIKSSAKHSSIHFQSQKWSYLQKHYSFHIFFHIGDIVDIPILVLWLEVRCTVVKLQRMYKEELITDNWLAYNYTNILPLLELRITSSSKSNFFYLLHHFYLYMNIIGREQSSFHLRLWHKNP